VDKPVLVVRGGIAGLTAALEIAEAGRAVVLVEKRPWLGGRVARMNLYFPKLCPPSCGLEMNYRRLRANPRITVLTNAEVTELTGGPGDWKVTLRLNPRHVSAGCTMCGDCAAACPAERTEDFAPTKAVYISGPVPYPAVYAIDRAACPPGCHACAETCKYGAIALDQAPETRTLQVASVVAATGWAPPRLRSWRWARREQFCSSMGPAGNAWRAVSVQIYTPSGEVKGAESSPLGGMAPLSIRILQRREGNRPKRMS
jgi:heterodisulfide reductase subunit A-like polyferredoxin